MINADTIEIYFNSFKQPYFLLDNIAYQFDVFAENVCLTKTNILPLYFHIVKYFIIKCRKDAVPFRKDVNWNV